MFALIDIEGQETQVLNEDDEALEDVIIDIFDDLGGFAWEVNTQSRTASTQRT